MEFLRRWLEGTLRMSGNGHNCCDCSPTREDAVRSSKMRNHGVVGTGGLAGRMHNGTATWKKEARSSGIIPVTP